MPWFKVDDGFYAHPKRLSLPLSATGLWTVAGSWSAQQLTDGAIPRHVLAILGGRQRDADALVTVGLWQETATGWQFTDWEDYQLTRAQVEGKRAAARKRMNRARNGHRIEDSNDTPDIESGSREHDANVAGSARAVTPTPSLPIPSLPIPASKEQQPSSDLADARPDVEHLCGYLATHIEANGAKLPAVTKRWREAARLMLDKDGRTEQQIINAIDWCQADEFWRANILSMPKLRDKYEQLRLAAARTANNPSRAAPSQSTADQRVAEGLAVAARLRQQEHREISA